MSQLPEYQTVHSYAALRREDGLVVKVLKQASEEQPSMPASTMDSLCDWASHFISQCLICKAGTIILPLSHSLPIQIVNSLR